MIFAGLSIAKLLMLTDLLASFPSLPDPCCAGRTRHRLLNMLVITVYAVVTGAETR